MGEDQIANLLKIFLIIFGFVLITLVIVYIYLLIRTKKNSRVKKEKEINPKNKVENSELENKYSKIEDFMEFEKIEDNMIIQKDNQKYIMVVECQGINYDLMSGIEKNAVEQGFIQFLNTLRHPIQIYIQTRTINLEGSINTYKKRVNQIEDELFRSEQEYQMLLEDNTISKKDKQKAFYTLTRQRNLYEYGIDIINDTEKMSQNSNILNKKYYIVIPVYSADLGNNEFSKEEIRNMVFSELYTRAQSIIRTISACGVKGKILNSKELVELLYIAYNREHEESFSFDRALRAQYDKLYSTSEDVYKKKIKELDKQIEEKAVKKAIENIDIARTEIEIQAREKETKMEELINEMAKIILEGNKEYLGEEIIEKATENIDKETKKKKEEKNEKNTRKNNSRK